MIDETLERTCLDWRFLFHRETAERPCVWQGARRARARKKFAHGGEFVQEFENLAVRTRGTSRPSLALRRKHAWLHARCKVALSHASHDIPFRCDVWKEFAPEFLKMIQEPAGAEKKLGDLVGRKRAAGGRKPGTTGCPRTEIGMTMAEMPQSQMVTSQTADAEGQQGPGG